MDNKLKILICATLLLSLNAQALEWVSPSPQQCNQNGGKLTSTGDCDASWGDSIKICKSLDASLPSLSSLKYKVTSCGGIVGQSDFNKNSSEYQGCYKRKGFSFGYYWSSTEHDWHLYSAHYLHIGRGTTNSNFKFDTNYVYCVK